LRKPREKVKGFDAEAFYTALAKVVEARNVPWRQVAKETGVAPSTLSRMGQGRRPDAASLAVLSAWAGINPADFVEKSDKHLGRPSGSARPASDAMVAIAALLRTDSNLQPGAAKALQDIIHIAYDKFKRNRAQEG
jgi:transcriptional regulator with XRE-family HTH domain